jgi:hypothetical protein
MPESRLVPLGPLPGEHKRLTCLNSFDAVVDPKKMSNYLISGASGPLR